MYVPIIFIFRIAGIFLPLVFPYVWMTVIRVASAVDIPFSSFITIPFIQSFRNTMFFFTKIRCCCIFFFNIFSSIFRRYFFFFRFFSIIIRRIICMLFSLWYVLSFAIFLLSRIISFSLISSFFPPLIRSLFFFIIFFLLFLQNAVKVKW